ncbi:hypothetical protein B7Z17_04275, partial [Candidatus Saccharibacteria bacterium 32-49-10]
MKETLSIGTWNVKGALSDPERANTLADAITASNIDVLTLPDAWHEDSSESTPSSRELLVSPDDFAKRGYIALASTFREDRPDDNFARYGFMTLVKETLGPEEYTELRLGERPAHSVQLELAGRALAFVGLYLNDQNEANRLAQLDDLYGYLEPVSDTPTILAG